MLKIPCVTDVFPGPWQKFAENLLEQTYFSNVYICEAKASGVGTHLVVLFNPLMLVW